MSSPLENLSGPGGRLQKEPPDATEFDNLVRSGASRLADAARPELSLDGRFDLAYNASHALSLAALRHAGYRPANNRQIVFQSLPHTLGVGPEVWRILDKAHGLRNASEYEGGGLMTERFVGQLIEAAKAVLRKVRELKPIARE